MRTLKAAVLMVGLAAALPLAGQRPAAADELICQTTIGPIQLDHDILVPPGQTCTLQGTEADGNLIVEEGASVTASDTRIGGQVRGERHERVNLRDSRVGGSVQLRDGGGADIARNRIGGDLTLAGNQGTQTVNANTVDGRLGCSGNMPPPAGGANLVHGATDEQCRHLLDPAQPTGHRLGRGASLGTGTGLTSADGRYRLINQTDGNLVLYRGNTALWSSGTHGRGASTVVLQTDGNLVSYAAGRPTWATMTFSGDQLVVQNDGNAVLYGVGPQGAGHRPVWHTDTWVR